MAEFDESKHPRDDDGRFTDGQNDARNKSIKQLEEEQRVEIKSPENIVVNPETDEPQFKSDKEARAYYNKELGKFADDINLSGATNAHSLHVLNKTLTNLTAEFPINKLGKIVVSRNLKNAYAQANGGGIEVSAKYLNNPTADGDWEQRIAPYPHYIEEYRKLLNDGGTPAQKKKWKNEIAKMKEEMKYQRWSVVDESENKIQAVITHEYGHVLADQIFGQITRGKYCSNYDNTWRQRELVNRVFAEVRTSGEIYKLSKYANDNIHEFFAECFAMRCAGEELPNNVNEMLKGVLGK